MYIEKKRKSSKAAKKKEKDDGGVKAVINNNNNNNDNNDNNDNDNDSSNASNIDKVTEEGQRLQNGHCHVQTEKEEEHDIVSDLPVFGRVRKLSHNQTPAGDNNNGFHVCDVIIESKL